MSEIFERLDACCGEDGCDFATGVQVVAVAQDGDHAGSSMMLRMKLVQSL